MTCPQCQAENREGRRFCARCGAPLPAVCPSCGFSNEPGERFCGGCGAPQDEPGAAITDEGTGSDAERRQLTVLFCDLVDSTSLASRLDPEELREVVRAYQETCAKVIARFEGHIAQYLGDGLLVYFGYPRAHEDDAQRAVRAGLGMVEALGQLNARLERERRLQLAVRVGIHTGPVVVGDLGERTRPEQLALGETPNVAARLQGIAAPNALVISAATFKLLRGFFACQPLGAPFLKGLPHPIEVYQVLYESTARSRLDVAGSATLTPLVGREQEIRLLLERWEQVKDGFGQVLLLSGEAGIGKSRLVRMLAEHVAIDPQAWLTPCRCSPYHQNSALYPMIDLLEHVVLRFDRDETPQQRLSKLEGLSAQYGLPLEESVPLLASLLSVPLTGDYAPLNVSSERQKQKTLQALLTILLRIAAQRPVLFVMEDLHWVDPSTLELLTLLVDQGPTARILTLLTFRPDFSPPWTGRSHLTQMTLHRLARRQAAEMTGHLAGNKALPAEVIEQVVARTDGVPLFLEELTKMVLESGLLQEREDRYELAGLLPPLAIPTTLHDSLMARLDRLSTVKNVAQLGATLGREFSYELLRAVSPWDEQTLQRGLGQLVKAELVYQRGLVPEATYLFKHALIQEVAYQSLLRSTRQRSHLRIAQALEARFTQICEVQPELLAHHYSEAGLAADAIPYWLRAGQRAIQTSANLEAIGHLTRGLQLLQTLPESPARAQQELTLQTTLGVPLLAIKGMGSPDVERVYARARELALELSDAPQLSSVLWGLWWFYEVRGDMPVARELAEQLLAMARSQQDAAPLMQAHRAMGQTLLWLGEFVTAREHLEQGIALYEPEKHRSMAFTYGQDPSVVSRAFTAHVLWYLGFPDQSLRTMHTALALASELSHPFTLAVTVDHAAWLHQYRREGRLTKERAEADMTLATAQGFPFFFAQGTILHGWSLAEQGRTEEGITEIRRGLTAHRATGAGVDRPYWLLLLAEACGMGGHVQEGLEALDEALADVSKNRLWFCQAELLRLRGELLLKRPVPEEAVAETSFHEAIEIARRQQTKSLELRAVMSLSRLCQRRGKREDARRLLAEIYGWFTEGFDTADLQDARALLDELATR